MKKLKILMVAGAATMLSSCDLSQIPGLDGKVSVEDSKAVGAACRHSGRALEDCFAMNPKTHPSGVFDGWRDMNDYMVANQIEVVKPEIHTSAFKPEKESAGEESSSPHAPGGSDHADTSKDSAPPVQGRQRWTPKGAAEPSASVPPGVTPAQAEPKKDESANAEPAAPASPARPWERKKETKPDVKNDPKKHT